MARQECVSNDRPPSTDAQWEYEVVRVVRGDTRKEAEDPQSQLNEVAADGWRFVDTMDYTGGGTKYLVFERPVQSGTPSDDADEGTTS